MCVYAYMYFANITSSALPAFLPLASNVHRKLGQDEAIPSPSVLYLSLSLSLSHSESMPY